MKVRKTISVCLSIILCFLMMSPAYALNIEQPTMYSVKVLPGSGKILVNNEESKKNFYNPNYFDYQYHFVYASPSDFEEIEDIETEVGEYETVKNRINYSAEGLEADWHEWYNDAFVTSTRIVRGILSKDASLCFTYAEKAVFKNCDFSFATAEESEFINCRFINCNFKSGIFTHSDFTGSKFENCKFEKTVFHHSLISGMEILDENGEKESTIIPELYGSTSNSELWQSENNEGVIQS